MGRVAKPSYEIFSDRLQNLRNKVCITQEQLAEAMEVSVSTVRAWESRNKDNHREPSSLADLAKLADYFNVTTDYLLGLSPEENPHLKSIAKEIGISQAAVRKLQKSLEKYGDEKGRNLVLNVLIMNANWDAFCSDLLSLRSDLISWSENPSLPPLENRQGTLVLSGGELFRYRFDALISKYKEPLANLLSLERRIQYGDAILRSRVEATLEEERQRELEINGEESGNQNTL